MDSYLLNLGVWLDKTLGVTDGIRANRIQKNGHTKLNSTEWRKIAQRMYEIGIKENGKGGKWRGKVYEAIGKPYWDAKGNPVTDVSKGKFYQFKTANGKISKPYGPEQMAAYNKTQSANRKKVTNVLDPAVQKQADALTKANKWPPGKSLKQFLSVEKAGETKFLNSLDGIKKLGLDTQDGHIREVGGKGNKNGTPLDAKGEKGSHSFRSRVPQMRIQNETKSSPDISKIQGVRAGIPMTNSAAFNQYLLSNDQGTGTHLTRVDKQNIGFNGKNPDQVVENRVKINNKFKALKNNHNIKNYHGVGHFNMDDTMYNEEDIYYEELFDQPNYRGLHGGPFVGV